MDKERKKEMQTKRKEKEVGKEKEEEKGKMGRALVEEGKGGEEGG